MYVLFVAILECLLKVREFYASSVDCIGFVTGVKEYAKCKSAFYSFGSHVGDSYFF
jgi:hypothetical protein